MLYANFIKDEFNLNHAEHKEVKVLKLNITDEMKAKMYPDPEDPEAYCCPVNIPSSCIVGVFSLGSNGLKKVNIKKPHFSNHDGVVCDNQQIVKEDSPGVTGSAALNNLLDPLISVPGLSYFEDDFSDILEFLKKDDFNLARRGAPHDSLNPETSKSTPLRPRSLSSLSTVVQPASVSLSARQSPRTSLKPFSNHDGVVCDGQQIVKEDSPGVTTLSRCIL